MLTPFSIHTLLLTYLLTVKNIDCYCNYSLIDYLLIRLTVPMLTVVLCMITNINSSIPMFE